MPDLNSVPPSPHFLASSSRRASSQQMPPPPVPGSPSLNTVNPSSLSAMPSPNLPSNFFAVADNSGVGSGPGPVRHARPLTAAEIYSQLEKEQEAVVNRLSRELTTLRAAQNASVVSSTSSTSASASLPEPTHWVDVPYGPLGNTYQPRPHRRTSSSTSASARSFTANAGSVSTTSMAGISSPVPVRPTTNPPLATQLSRQTSSASHRSRTASPSPAPQSLSSSYTHVDNPPTLLASYFNPRFSTRSQSNSAAATPTSTATTATTTVSTPSESMPGILQATARYEETALRRAELEEMKLENEELRRRVMELEKMVRDAGRGRGRARAGDGEVESVVSGVGVGVPEDEVRVGESAASRGVGRGRGRGGM